ncbi:helix-turn-helix domain-containing protein [uncultured Microbulbifer sp.]|uniref:helix-turn-helix domain-containing protein n=1 Tax=uncultured Microbulbifer sp. TaxID=348147 RepID=UPI00261259F8|nr:helix-turn-helix domain-containing protein [uncultured Microbulbifer sp.]
MRHYKQLSYEQRSQIEKSNKIGFSQAQIALTVGVNRSTISRELARSRGQRGYRDKQAQKFALSHREEARKVTKMIPELTNLVEDKLAEK